MKKIFLVLFSFVMFLPILVLANGVDYQDAFMMQNMMQGVNNMMGSGGWMVFGWLWMILGFVIAVLLVVLLIVLIIKLLK